ncbi:beta strand repeat-containing protein [Marmoricola sp. RAF53]|uniref:beta strand repeat-containing protein n=1 Tax=Marmoricola sp. RAF53 TaxID=3233059 RepID=UPI003F9BFDEE
MSKRSSGPNRKRFRTVLVAGVVAGTLGLAAPAQALLGITLPAIPLLNPAPTPITIAGDPTSDTDTTPDVNLDLSGVNPTLEGILGLTNLTGGLTQTTTTLTQLLSGLKDGAAVAAPVVQAHATEAAQTAIENLQARLQATAADAAALDPAGAQEETAGILTDLQGQALSEVAGLLPLALTTGLQVAQDIVTPVCSLTAIPTSLIPGVGVDTTNLYTAAAPIIQQTDVATNQLLRDTYSQLYDNTLASVNNIPNVGPIAGALLTLLKYNWTSSYTPPGSSTPIVTTTKALMNVPTPIDVDHDGLFDLCGTTSFALTGSGTSISGIKFTQSLTKMPLAKAVLPVQIGGGLLNVLNFGYDTRESTVPVVYTTSATLDGSNLNVDNNYAVHRGTNLTIPPLALSSLDLVTNDGDGIDITVPPLLKPAPKPIVTQEICISSCATLAIRDRFENVPASTHVDGPLASAGVKVNYSAPSTSDSYSHTFGVSTLSLGTVVGKDRPAVGTTPARTFSAPTAATSCLSISDGTCSPNSIAGDKYSTGFTASTPTSYDQDVILSGTNSADCSAVGSINSVVRVSDTTKFFASAVKGGTGVGSGRLAVDTGDDTVDGCLTGGSTLNLTGAPVLTLPSGFKSDNRVATYHIPTLQQPVPDSKSGTITCPTGLVAQVSALIYQANLQPVICFLPPIAAKPTITGQFYVQAPLTANTDAWLPPAPNKPTFTYQWSRCDAAGANCQTIPGATASTFTPQYGSYPAEPTDWHKRFKVAVVGTNLDGTASATSDVSSLIELPPAPVNATVPTLSANRAVGTATTTTNGTWNNGVSSYAYQWLRCSADTLVSIPACQLIPGATTSSYTLTTTDKGTYLRSRVIATNLGGPSAPAYSAAAYIPNDPVNNVAPKLKNGPVSAVGQAVQTGDKLVASTSTGDWKDANSFTYQWQLCDGAGANCADFTNPSAANKQFEYVVRDGDVGSTLRVQVTGVGTNGSTTVTTGTTGVVTLNDLIAKTGVPVADGQVNATAAGSSGTTFLGGVFDTVGAPTGGAAVVAGANGKTMTLPSGAIGSANGAVNVVIADGSNGYYLGGSFTQVLNADCPRLAHVRSDGTLDSRYCLPGSTGTVKALTRNSGGSNALGVGGDFSYDGHQNFLVLDTPATGAVTPRYLPNGDPNGAVLALASNSSNRIFLGGEFGNVDGANAARLAAVTVTASGTTISGIARDAWAQGVCTGTVAGASATCGDAAAKVKGLFWNSASSTLFVVGRFDVTFRTTGALSAALRGNGLVVADAGATPTLYGWDPKTSAGPTGGTINTVVPGPFTLSNILTGAGVVAVYIGGDFDKVNNVAIPRLAETGVAYNAYSPTDVTKSFLTNTNTNTNAGAPMTTWVPSPNGVVNSLSFNGSAAGPLFVGGDFTTINTGAAASPTTLVRHRLARVNMSGASSTTLPVVDAAWDANAGREVRSVFYDGSKLLVGGAFTVVGGENRANLAEVNPATKAVTGWAPNPDGAVSALAVDGTTVYAAGAFTKIGTGGSTRAGLAAVDGSGAATSWNPGVTGSVKAIAANGTVYLGGAFTNVGGQARANLAAVDASGAVTGWNPGANGTVNALALDGGNVYVGGAFTTVGGQPRANTAAVDGSGSVTAFDPGTNGPVKAIAVNIAGAYLGGSFTQVGGQGRAHLARVDAGTGALDTGWNPGVDGDVNALLLFGNSVFVGGDFANAGGQPRRNAAALKGDDDAATAFDPQPNGPVRSISRTTGGTLVLGGPFLTVFTGTSPGAAYYGG